MLSIRGRPLLLIALAGAGLIAGCGESPSDGASTPSSKPKTPAAKPSVLPPEMVAAVAPGKASTLISVHFALGNSPTIDRELPVAIAIVPHREFVAVRAHFEAHDGVTVTSGSDFGPANAVAAEKPLRHELRLMPSKDGLYMVTAIVETEDNDGSVTRVFSIPVIVGMSAPTSSAASAAPAKPANP